MGNSNDYKIKVNVFKEFLEKNNLTKESFAEIYRFDKEEVELFLHENAELKYYQVIRLAKLMHMKCDELIISEN